MSANTQETGRHADRKQAAPVAPATPAAPAVANTVTIEIAGLEVTLPVKFTPGHVLTDAQAKVLDAAYQRQFTNNQNAMAKARAEALLKATDDASKAKYAPQSATQLAALYSDYEPSVGGTRTGSMEKIRQDAAWRMWSLLVSEHNSNVAAGGEAIIKKAGNKPVALPTGKGAAEKREAMVTSLLNGPAAPVYADRIQVQVDQIMAERGKKAETTAETIVSGNDLL